ncbi:hypothetical protein ES708_04971 [subsurface metagenome]
MFTHSIVVQNEDVTAGTSPSYDLPVSPMSHLLLTLKFTQTAEVLQCPFMDIPALLAKVEVLYKGAGVTSLNGIDLLACGILICDFESWGVNATGQPEAERSLTFLVPFGRQLYSPIECYPSTSRGELILQVTYQGTFSTYIDNVKLQVEAVELPDAHPERFLKMTTSFITPTAVADYDVELPIGNQISDIVLWGTTFPAANADTASISQIQIRKNNSEFMYSKTNYETLHNMMGRMRCPPGYWGLHTHDALETPQVVQAADSIVDPNNHILKQHLLVPFDVRRDGQHILRTDDANDLNIRISPDDQLAVRVIPCEVVAISAR